MSNISAQNRWWGVTAGAICFVILYGPLADVLIRYYRWKGIEPIRDLVIGLLICYCPDISINILWLQRFQKGFAININSLFDSCGSFGCGILYLQFVHTPIQLDF